GKSFSLREVEFLRRSAGKLEAAALKVFTDTSCTKLLANYSQSDYLALPELLRVIETELKQNRYAGKEFRMASYRPFSSPELANKLRHIQPLNPFDNPTGIHAKEGDEIYVFVGDTNGQLVSLASVKPYSLQSVAYPLFEGFNKITIRQTGLLYVMYNADMSKSHKAITIHIPKGSGTVNGYFDIRRHDDKDWQKLIAAAKADVFDIVGRYSMMILDRKALQAHSPDSIVQSVNVWDESMRAIWKLQGFHKYKLPINNRQLGFSTDGGAHMFSAPYGCGYSVGSEGVTLKNEVIAPGIIQGTRLWGIGHEVGHSNQALINWPSMTESSNNTFAQLLLDQVAPQFNGGVVVSDMENPCKYLHSEAVKGMPFHDLNGWAKWGFAQYSFYLYFHKVGINPDFYPDLFESLRKSPIQYTNENVAKAHLAWYERICHQAKLDFTEDFEVFNWFVPCNISAHQYGDYKFIITKEMADASKKRVAAKRYPKPKYRIAFMHQHAKEATLWGLKMKGSELNGYWTKYRDNAKLSAKVSARKQGSMITISNGENAAAFCVKSDGKIVAYYDRPQFDVADISWNAKSELYAIPIQTAEAYKKLKVVEK
ncbi:MAG: M60 family metallopeptidase, partial [Akkermansia sp.]